ncbi:RICIN domain-containing protein [Mucilaginibacter sp. cycad4]|uniref:RICIN domain-containing protein n=1 Tax=Mucilaginibacter sp. cycad4 TaxID=3342096 RepID=UPI002AAABF32|nr:RICIN domain-containing protein [Mucilaginibacter gossypii]WPV02140.1 RICIN domain-containing protein [Mucilaginibacter gossypii]
MKLKLMMAAFCLVAILQSCSKEKSTPTATKTVEIAGINTNLKLASLPPTNSWVSIRNRNSGQGFQLPGYNISDGTQIIQWPDGGGANGRFKFTSIGTNIYRITPSMPYGLAKCVEVLSESTANGATIDQYTYNGGTHQQWNLVDLGNGYFQIINVKSGKAIEVPGSSTSNGTGLTQNTPNTSAYNQQWSFVDRGPTTVNVSCNGCSPWQSGFIAGSWTMMHRNDNATLSSDGGTSSYVCRYETEYWVGSGAIVPPTIQVISGTNTLTATSGTSNAGTCTGTAFPQEATYSLNGTVKWTDNEVGCSYNLALRSL